MQLNKKYIDLIRKYKVFEIIVFGFFVFMMLFHITHSALWGDEWVEYNFSQASILSGEMYSKVITTFQPPLYNFLMHFWLLISNSVLWFRCFNVFLGGLAGVLLFQILKKFYDKKTAGLTMCVLAVSYQWIYCIQECSEYALMLCMLFGAIYFYVLTLEEFKYSRLLLFVLCTILAIYSQYGAVFVALPLLFLFYIGKVFGKSAKRKEKIAITVTYAVSFFLFALPLYFFFLKKQMLNNQIADNKVMFTWESLMDLPFILGKIIGYFFNLNSGDIWPIVFGVISVIVMAVSVMVVAKGCLDWKKKSLIICLWIGYILHYILVQFHIYAMTHPGQSAGFFVRYSYFYIPILSVVLPILIKEYKSIANTVVGQLGVGWYAAILLSSMIVISSFLSTLKNWNKALDNYYAKIWIENHGWEDATYLYGIASYGFNYYVSHDKEYKEGFLDKAQTTVDNTNLPLKFWAWRTNWGGDGWQETIDRAAALGYSVTVYDNSYYAGQLAYCSYDKPIDELTMDEIMLKIDSATLDENGLLHVNLLFRNEDNCTIEYNKNDYRLSYHLYDSNGNVLVWDNERIYIKKWVDYNTCEIKINITEMKDRDFIITFDMLGEKWLSEEGGVCPSLRFIEGNISY